MQVIEINGQTHHLLGTRTSTTPASWTTTPFNLATAVTTFVENALLASTTPELPHTVVVGWPSVVLIIVMAVLSVLTVVGNLIVLLSFILDKSIRQPSNYFIFSLAVSDLLFLGNVSKLHCIDLFSYRKTLLARIALFLRISYFGTHLCDEVPFVSVIKRLDKLCDSLLSRPFIPITLLPKSLSTELATDLCGNLSRLNLISAALPTAMVPVVGDVFFASTKRPVLSQTNKEYENCKRKSTKNQMIYEQEQQITSIPIITFTLTVLLHGIRRTAEYQSNIRPKRIPFASFKECAHLLAFKCSTNIGIVFRFG
ncbi:7 transmembrane receptor (rhodopsin family) domain-containing protein [Ditylenchus destructor]|uniref:7 transmembrane receptor (Rhodopsin family) domain-containing protein n=1 Tax=Ditylenchus destructor TaxID=166010 RepID=A0AAD4NFC2_9BILA|nr:7 transmembrane receptor (rhodopsin family) domain-containing protein [Ditylenchus destructor]